MATNLKTTKAKPAPLPTPPSVQSIWETVTNKTMLQLFHPSPEKRIAAVAAMKAKHHPYDKRSALLIAAAIHDPDTSVRAAMLDAVADVGRYVAWSDALHLREDAKVFLAVDDAGLHLALAKCFAEIPVPLMGSDLRWIMALVEDGGSAARDGKAFCVVVQLIARAIRTGVAQREALAAYQRLMLHTAYGSAAWARVDDLKEHGAALVPALIELCAQGGKDASEVAAKLALIGSTANDSRAISTLEALRDADQQRAWVMDLCLGLFDRASLPARIEQHREHINAALAERPTHGVIIEALSFCPEKARDWAQVCASRLLCDVGRTSHDTMQRWVRGNPALVASAVEELLFNEHDGYRYMAWWDQLRPETAAVDAVRGIEKTLADCPRGELSGVQQRLCEACCALIERVGRAPDGALAALARLGARQVPHLVSDVIPTARAMHKLGAKERDFAPIVEAYDRAAIAFEQQFPTEDHGVDWRTIATALIAMGTFETTRARWSVFASIAETPRPPWSTFGNIFGNSFGDEEVAVMTMLAPFLDQPEVEALFERSLTSRWAQAQRHAAAALGLLVL